MRNEIENLRAQIPEDVLKNIRTDSPSVLRKIVKQLSKQQILQEERKTSENAESRQELLVRLFKKQIKEKEVEIRTHGGTESLSNTLMSTKTVVAIICPDFETEQTAAGLVYKAGGRIKSGIGLTGQRLTHSLPLLENVSEITGGLDLFVLYQASAEEVITPVDVDNIRKSSESMKRELSKVAHNFRSHFMVMETPDLTKKARDLAQNIKVSEKDVANLTRDREEIIRMRLGIVNSMSLSDELKTQEATFDIATHILSEALAKELTGKEEFVHFSVDSARFSAFYKNPAVAVGRNVRYKGD